MVSSRFFYVFTIEPERIAQKRFYRVEVVSRSRAAVKSSISVTTDGMPSTLRARVSL